jgi:hypothetical protein
MSHKIVICQDFDIPYVGGYNNAGTIVYIDRHLPRTFRASTNVNVDLHKYLIIHELTEVSMMTNLGLSFNEAHKIALGAEISALQKDGCPVDEYYSQLYKHIDKKLLPENIRMVPKDLNLQPYIDDELTAVLDAIAKCRNSQVIEFIDDYQEETNILPFRKKVRA